jgi:hypothetical protein
LFLLAALVVTPLISKWLGDARDRNDREAAISASEDLLQSWGCNTPLGLGTGTTCPGATYPSYLLTRDVAEAIGDDFDGIVAELVDTVCAVDMADDWSSVVIGLNGNWFVMTGNLDVATAAVEAGGRDLRRDRAALLHWCYGEPLSPLRPSRSSIEVSEQCNDLGPGASLSGCRYDGRDLSGRDLTGADLSGANLAGADLTRAVLAGANLEDADLSEAKLVEADLSDASLTRVNLAKANLSGANLSGANLLGSALPGAVLSGVYSSAETIWPAMFDPPPVRTPKTGAPNLTCEDLDTVSITYETIRRVTPPMTTVWPKVQVTNGSGVPVDVTLSGIGAVAGGQRVAWSTEDGDRVVVVPGDSATVVLGGPKRGVTTRKSPDEVEIQVKATVRPKGSAAPTCDILPQSIP